MDLIALPLRAILHRLPQAELAREFGINKAKMNRVFLGKQQTTCLDECITDDVAHNYPLPDFSFSDEGVPVAFSNKLQARRTELMDCLIQHYHNDPVEVDLYVQEIRALINDGSFYDPDTETVHTNHRYLDRARTMLAAFPKLQGIPGWKRKICDRWARYNGLSIDILERAATSGFKKNCSLIHDSKRFIYQLIEDVKSSPVDSKQKAALEYLLLTKITQTTELLFLSGQQGCVCEMVQLITDIFGQSAEVPFRTLLIASAWKHTRPLIYEYFGIEPFTIYEGRAA